jgi:carbonic anhydrase/acetyltransferase-like protein (isoleucine patch superfamily)
MKRDHTKVVVGKSVYIAPTSYVGGHVVLGDHCTVMPHASIRGDFAPIRLGQRVNVQDGTVLHTDLDVPLEIGDDVTIGPGAVVHCTSVGAGSLVGIRATLLDGVVLGKNCMVAIGAVVTPGTEVPDGMLVAGAPARVQRPVTDHERAELRLTVEAYVKLGAQHWAGRFPNTADEHMDDQSLPGKP